MTTYCRDGLRCLSNGTTAECQNADACQRKHLWLGVRTELRDVPDGELLAEILNRLTSRKP